MNLVSIDFYSKFRFDSKIWKSNCNICSTGPTGGSLPAGAPAAAGGNGGGGGGGGNTQGAQIIQVIQTLNAQFKV